LDKKFVRLISSMYATYSAHRNVLDLTIVTIIGEECTVWRFLLSDCLYPTGLRHIKVQMFSSVIFCQTLLFFYPLLECATKFHTHVNQQITDSEQ